MKVLAFPKDSKLNPHMRLLYGALAAHDVSVSEGSLGALIRSKYDLVHYHWPERFLNRKSVLLQCRGLLRFALEMLLIRINGGRVVWTVQNIKGHEERTGTLSRIFRSIFFRNLDGFISLSHAAHGIVHDMYPVLKKRKSVVVPRGHYRSLYPNPPDRRSARSALELPSDAIVIGLVGLIRRYKNIPWLISCFRKIEHPALHLLVTGECTDTALRTELEQLAAADPRVRLDLQFVAEADLPGVIRALDLMVLPYTDILNSGAALLALSLDVPVLAPAKGTLVEVAQAVGTDWVRTYEGELTDDIVAQGIAWARQPRSQTAPLGYFDWDANARATARFFRSLLPDQGDVDTDSGLGPGPATESVASTHPRNPRPSSPAGSKR